MTPDPSSPLSDRWPSFRYHPDPIATGSVGKSTSDASVSEILRPGDIIEEVGGQPVETPEDFEALAKNFQPGQRAILLITRGKYRSYVVIGP